MIKFGAQAVASLVDPKCRERIGSWLGLLEDCLAAAGGLAGTQTPSGKRLTVATRPNRTNMTASRDAMNGFRIPTTWA